MPVHIVRSRDQANTIKTEPKAAAEQHLPASFLSVKQAAAYAGVSEPTIRRKITAKLLPVFRLGVQIRIDQRDLVALMRTDGQR